MPGKLGFDVAGFQLDITKSAEIDAVVECIKNKLAPDFVHPAPQPEVEAAIDNEEDADRRAGAIPSFSHTGVAPAWDTCCYPLWKQRECSAPTTLTGS